MLTRGERRVGWCEEPKIGATGEPVAPLFTRPSCLLGFTFRPGWPYHMYLRLPTPCSCMPGSRVPDIEVPKTGDGRSQRPDRLRGGE